MTGDKDGGDGVAWEAAHLAVFALRSTIHPSMLIALDAYAVAPDRHAVLSNDAIVARFVAARKPLICDAVVSSRGVVVISLEPPKSSTLRQLGYTAALDRVEHTARDPSQSLSASIQSLASAAGMTAEDAGVLCVGRNEMRLFSRSAVERWEREYGIVGGGYALGSVEESTAPDQRPYREARARGAACVLRFGGLSKASPDASP